MDNLKWNRKSSKKSEVAKKVRRAITKHLDPVRNEKLQALVHKAIPFVMGNRIVRKRVYFRWCIRHGLDPTLRENVNNFANRKQWQRDQSELKRKLEALQFTDYAKWCEIKMFTTWDASL